jgi:hypothetical protein
MSALASLDDVNRILGRTTGADETADAKTRAALDAVNSWAESALWKISAEGPNVEVYFDQPEDGTLYLPAPDVTVTKVKIFPYGSGNDSFFFLYTNSMSGTGQGYDIDDQGRLILRPMRTFAPFEGARAERFLRTYSRVEVHYIGTGVIPKGVTEGIAFLAAGYIEYGPKVLSGMKSERIGDYSYTLQGQGTDEELPYMRQARMFLGRYLRKQRVRVI